MGFVTNKFCLFCGTELHCFVKAIKNPSVNYNAELGNVLHNYNNIATVVYYKSIPRTPFCCCEQPLEYELCVNPPSATEITVKRRSNMEIKELNE